MADTFGHSGKCRISLTYRVAKLKIGELLGTTALSFLNLQAIAVVLAFSGLNSTDKSEGKER